MSGDRRGPGLAFTVLAALWGGAATLGVPAMRLLLLRRLRAGKEIAARLGERRGCENGVRPAGRLVWLHAASVGETLSLLPLIDALRCEDPALFVLLTTATATAQALAIERLPADTPDSRIRVRFVPFDVPAWVTRFLDHWRPDGLVLVESELWPTMIRLCYRRSIPMALVNARLSGRSARRWARAGGVARQLFRCFSLLFARSVEDAERLRQLGVDGVEHHGDLKRAAEPLPHDGRELDRLRTLLAGRPLWLAASTHAGEEEEALRLQDALRRRHPDALLVIAPRHPNRGDNIAALRPGLRRRALGEDPRPEDAVWLCDTLGELGLLYRLCPVVLLGNSLATAAGRGGGHNPIEPARLGCALGSGPRMENFAADTEALVEAGALTVLPDRAAMLDWLGTMLDDPAKREAASLASLSLSGRERDLPKQLARRLLSLMPAHPA